MPAHTTIKDSTFLDIILEQFILIAQGKCTITEDTIESAKGEKEKQILMALMFMHQDLELSRLDLKRAVEAEFSIKLLEAKNRELEQFVYVASHDLQEPLRTIMNFSSLIQKGQLDAKNQLYFKYISESSKRMSQLIKCLLDYSRLGVKDKKETVNLNEVLEGILHDLHSLIKDSQAKIITTSTLPSLPAYHTPIRLLLQNLISNAIKFRKKDQPPIVHINATRNENMWEFSIKDNGIGIAPEFHEKVFLIFKRLHSKTEFEGTGIGLAQCKKIVSLHNGDIWVESELGKGSTFFFTLKAN